MPCLKAGGAEVLIDRERFEAGKALLGQMDAAQDAADPSAPPSPAAAGRLCRPGAGGRAAKGDEAASASLEEPLFGPTPVERVRDWLQAHPDWQARADVLAELGLSVAEWNEAMREMVAFGEVEKKGQRRGTRYRLVWVRGVHGLLDWFEANPGWHSRAEVLRRWISRWGSGIARFVGWWILLDLPGLG